MFIFGQNQKIQIWLLLSEHFTLRFNTMKMKLRGGPLLVLALLLVRILFQAYDSAPSVLSAFHFEDSVHEDDEGGLSDPCPNGLVPPAPGPCAVPVFEGNASICNYEPLLEPLACDVGLNRMFSRSTTLRPIFTPWFGLLHPLWYIYIDPSVRIICFRHFYASLCLLARSRSMQTDIFFH